MHRRAGRGGPAVDDSCAMPAAEIDENFGRQASFFRVRA